MKIKKFMKGVASVSAAALLTMPLSQYGAVFISDAASGICINEVCAKNTTYAAPDGGFYDWIELYNPTSSSIDLSGYGLSDKESKPYRFTFPAGTSIGAGQRVMVFCDSEIPEISGSFTAAFGLSTSGETLLLTTPDGQRADSITFGAVAADVSYGRVPDGSDNFATLRMSPNAPNEQNTLIEVDVPEPVFSQEGGFYDSGFSLTISGSQNTKVYYTLDGSVPTTSSTPYTSPIQIEDISSQPNNLSAITDIKQNGAKAPAEPVDKAMVVNAIAVDDKGNVSDVVSGAYFIGYGNNASYYKDVKVISLTTDADNLFDHEKGIYVMGKVYEDWQKTNGGGLGTQEWEIPTNFSQKGREWERPASIQVYENGKLAHTQDVGIRIHGGATRTAPQKSFNVYARADYGASKFEYDLFDGTVRSEATGKKIKEFDSFILRNGGNDVQATRFRDKLNQGLVSDRDFLSQGMVPCIVFINGEYWGQYEITERLSDDYIKAHTGVSKNDVCLIKNGELEEGDQADFDEWNQLEQWVKSTDMSNEANYRQLCEKVDMQSFADYMSAEIYLGNQDFSPNNAAMWKATTVDPENEYADGKWRFILFDTEYSTGLYGSFQSGPNIDVLSKVLQSNSIYGSLLKSALNNAEFKQLFTTTFMDMVNENYNIDRVNSMIDELSAQYHDMAVDTLDRFYSKSTPAQTENPGETNPNPGWGGIGGPGGWGGGGWGDIGWGTTQSNEETFNSEVNTVKNFYRDRLTNAVNQLKNNCKLGQTATLTLKNDVSQGTVKLNSITPTFKNGTWSGLYFTDYPVTLMNEPAEGVGFSSWSSSDGKSYTSATASADIKSDVTITANYGESKVLKGDVNNDGQVNAADLVMLSKWLLRSSKELSSTSNADVCSDGIIDTFDLIALRKLVIG